MRVDDVLSIAQHRLTDKLLIELVVAGGEVVLHQVALEKKSAVGEESDTQS
jgi:hypothetical protein